MSWICVAHIPQGGVRMANPSMVPPGPGMAGQAMVPGSSGQMHLRAPRPSQTGLLIILKYTCQMSL